MAHPLWLLGLIPWTALTLYLLIGRRRDFLVPFLPLWPKFQATSSTRHFHPPPPAIVAALAAIGLSILAAAGPRWSGRGSTDRPVTIIVDRGFTMSARDGRARRFQSVADEAAPHIVENLGAGPADLIIIPGTGPRHVDRADWAGELKKIGPTAVATQAAVAQAVRTALLNPQAIVILLSDQKINVTDVRLVQIASVGQVNNIGIADFSIRLTPTPQAMVRLENDSSLRQTTMRISGADPVVVDLPGAGNQRDYFVNLTNPPDIAQAAIDPGGDIDADDHAWLVRGEAWPKIIARISLPPELQRMVDVYTRNRPPRSESKTISIAAFNSDLQRNEMAVLLPAAVDLTGPPPKSVQSESSPITDGVNWTQILSDAQTTAAQPDADWTPFIRADGRTLLAIHPDFPRRVWLGFSSPTWAATPEFVVFWTKVFDWLGQGSDQFTSTALHSLDAEWKPDDSTIQIEDAGLWPGVYRHGDQTLAVNCAPIPSNAVEPTEWRKQLAALSAEHSSGTLKAAPWLLLTAIGCMLFAALRLKRRVLIHV